MTCVPHVVRYLLSKDPDMPSMKLQKLCYYVQAWSLVWDGEPLIEDRLEAWRDGPVFPLLYQRQRHSPEELSGEFDLSDRERLVIDRVLADLGDRTAAELSDMTHREDPWRAARLGAGPNDHTDAPISAESIRSYFMGLSKSPRDWQESEPMEETVRRVVEARAEMLDRLA